MKPSSVDPRAVLFATLLFLVVPPLPAGEAPDDAATDMVVFMGLDISLPVDGALLPVVDASSSSIEVLRDASRMRVPIAGQLNFKTSPEPKVSRGTIQLDDLKAVRVYSAGANPGREAADQQMLMASIETANQQAADRQLGSAINNAEGISRAETAGHPVSAADKALAGQQMASAIRGLNTAYGTGFGGGFDPSALLFEAEGEGRFDAFEIAARISTPEPVDNAYAVLRLIVTTPGDNRVPVITLKFFSLPKLGPEPRRVVLQQAGLPPGFGVERYELHVYSNGREVATNLSSNRMDVRPDEAFQFLLLRHLAQHGKASRPIEAARDLIPADFRAHVAAEQMNRSVDLTVDADGHVTMIRLQPVASSAHDASLEKAIRDLRFLPALLNGKPVAAQATFVLSELLP